MCEVVCTSQPIMLAWRGEVQISPHLIVHLTTGKIPSTSHL